MANEFKVKNGLIVDGGGANITGSSFITGSLTVSSGITGSLFGSASYAFTASYALNAGGASIDTGSFATTGSNTFRGNQTVTGSLFTSGSNVLVGNTTLTGSLSISGSTTQIGSNNLLGNTSLSGSITISGSQNPSTPTIQIFGDTQFTGLARFNPIARNIDSSISASYIYVSGSTNDLYFSQNGSGYANSTRLRWIEGNLYTGLLGGGVLSSTPGSTVFTLTSGSGIIVSLNAVTGSSNPFPTIQYINWNTFTNVPITNSGSAKITYISVTSAGAINQQVVPIGTTDINQWDTQIEIGVVLHLSGSVSTGVYNSPQLAYGYAQRTDDFLRAFGPLKVSGHTLQASGSSPTLSIKKSSGTAYNNGSNYVINPNHASLTSDPDTNISKIYRYYISGSTPIIDTGIANAGYTAIDSKQYVDTTTGTLTTVGAGFFSIQRVFWIPNSPTNAFIVYYGNAKYGNLVDAKNGIDTETFLEAPNTAQNGILLGYIIIQGGGTGTPARDLLNASEAAIIQAGLFRNVGGIGSSGTAPIAGTLAGLADVSISSPTNGQPLVYNSVTSKWENQSTLTATLVGNASTSTSASYAATTSLAPNYVLNSVTQSMLSPYVLSSNTGSFITNSQTSSMSVLSASFASTASSADNFLVRGTLTAQTIVAQTITSSTDYVTGSTRFGSLITNTHQFTGSMSITGGLSITNGVINNLTSSYAITASYWSGSILNSTSASYAATASFAPNYVLNSSTSSFVTNNQTSSFVTNSQTSSMSVLSSSFASTASYVNILNQSVIIANALAIGTSSLGATENTLVIGPSPAGGIGEGGQILLQSSGGLYTSASMIDTYQNQIRVLRGTNAGSDALITQWNLHTKQMQLPAYTGASSFVGTATANLAVDSGGNVITVSTSGGTVFPYTGIASINGGLIVTGSITASGAIHAQANGAMYFRGGDDAEFWDINVVNTVGIYGQQDATVASIKLGSGGGTISGRSGNIGVGTITPNSGSLHVSGNVFATSFTGSLLGTASFASTASLAPNYVLNSSTSSFITNNQTGSFITNSQTSSMSVLSASFASTASLAPAYVLNSSTSSMLSPYVLSSNTGSFITNSQTSSMSVLSSSYAATASLAPNYVLNATTASMLLPYVLTSVTSSMSVLSSSYAATASSADNFLVRGTLTAQTIVAQTITSSTDYVTGSTRFGSLITNTHQFTGSMSITGSLVVIGSISSSLGFTGSLFGTASIATTASYALTSSLSISSSFSTTASYSSNGFPFSGSAIISGSLLVSGSLSVGTNEFSVQTTGVNLGNLITDTHTVTGSFSVSGSINIDGGFY